RAAADLEFERAARLRDDIGALTRAMEKQAVVFGDGTDADVVAFAQDEFEAAVQVFHVRGGRVRGQRGWVIDKVAEVSTGDLVEQFVTQIYGSEAEFSEGVPREVLVPELPEDVQTLTEWLSMRRGARVRLRVPMRGDKRSLMDTVQRNAEQAFARHKLRRASDLTARSQALAEIQRTLGLDDAPLRIECFDVSHVQGTNVVASMVVFEDGLPRKSEYRRFSIRTVDGDDTAWIAETVRRRFSRYLDERMRTGEMGEDPAAAGEEGVQGSAGPIDPATGRPRKFAYPPNLVVVDGGAPQVAAATRVLAELGIEDVALVGLAKRLEEVWLPGDDQPVILPRRSEALYLLQRVRDEAHRFAITYHRQRRSRAMTRSALDDVPGLGETRRRALLARFGSLKRLRMATEEEIVSVPGIGHRTAQSVLAALRGDTRVPDRAAGPTAGRIGEDEGSAAPDATTARGRGHGE
ncbi:MAG TPA: excinuclease ABC subunit UvrC, partial [Mycobacteriales bacterium]